MQQFKFFQPSFASRRHGFMRDIRNIQREDFKQKARSLVLTRTADEQLNYLMNLPNNYISNQDLGMLVKYANQHNHKAAAHIGNLIIDGAIKVTQLQKFTLQPDFHPHWLWLVQVLVQYQYCTIGLFQHCIRAVAPNRLQKTVNHALTVLYKITSSNMYSSFLMREENALLSIINACLRQDSASKVAYLLIHQLIIKEEGLAQRFKEGILRQRLMLAIKNGLLGNISIIKNDCFKIINELARKQVFCDQLNSIFINFLKSSDFEKHSEMYLEYILQLSLSGQQEALIEMINNGLLIELSHWKKQYDDEESFLSEKIIQIGRQIRQRVSDLGHLTKGIHSELQRLDLLSFGVAIQ